MKFQSTLIFLLLSIFANSSYAGKLDKAFEALEIYDYFKAKKLFEKSLKKSPSVAAYGLGVIFHNDKNPFHSLDSAYKYADFALVNYNIENKKYAKHYTKFNVNYDKIKNLRNQICEEKFEEIEQSTSPEMYQYYLDFFKACGDKDFIINQRNKLAFDRAKRLNTSEAYRDFISKYPGAKEIAQAKDLLEENKYEIATADKKIESYLLFIKDYPTSIYVSDAWMQIFVKETSRNTISDYQKFIKKYPQSPNVKDAWLKTYEIYTAYSNTETYLSFLFDYPNFPYKDLIEKDIAISKKHFLKFSENNKWGYIDTEGEIMINTLFDFAGNFSNGYATVGKNNKMGYINKKGKLVIPFLYDEAEPFGRETAIVGNDDFYGIIKRDGKLVLNIQFDEIFEFKEYHAVVMKDGVYGFINNDFQLIIPCQYDDASSFSDSLAKVSKNGYYGFINYSGETVIDHKFAWADNFSNGYARVKNDDDLFGVINKNGELVIDTIYDFIGKFNEGAALISSKNKFGYISMNGEIIVPITYDYNPAINQLGGFNNGLALVQKKDKIGFVNKKGKVEIPIKYDNALTFSENLSPVKIKDKWGAINTSNQLVIPAEFDYLWGFTNNLSRVKLDEKIGLIDINGDTIVPIEFKQITTNEFPYFITIDFDNKKGLYSNDGKLLLENKFDHIEIISEANIVQVQNRGKFAYFNLITNFYIWEEKGFTEL